MALGAGGLPLSSHLHLLLLVEVQGGSGHRLETLEFFAQAHTKLLGAPRFKKKKKVGKRFIPFDGWGRDEKEKARKIGANQVIASYTYFLTTISQVTASTLRGSDYPLPASDHSIIVLTFLSSSLSQHETGCVGAWGS